MMSTAGLILLVLSSCCLSLLDAQQITHPLDGTVLYIYLISNRMCKQ